jgi:spore protease
MKTKADFWNNNPGLSTLAGRLDLAVEANALLRGDADREVEGVAEEVINQENVVIHIITVLNEQGSKMLNRPPGRYITLDIPAINSDDDIAAVSSVVAGQLQALLPSLDNWRQPLLIVGLGNSNAIPDALGPRVVDMTYATRHIFHSNNAQTEGLSCLCAIAPGVLGNSGIETAEIILGICEHIKPVAMIVVDSLAAASISRVGTTIQMSNTGIKPGSGLGYRGTLINSDLTGCPVVAIGVPTVVDTASIISETVQSLDSFWKSNNKLAGRLDEKACRFAEEQLLERFQGQLMVTPKDIDELIAKDAEILSAAIAIASHPAASRDNYHDFIR